MFPATRGAGLISPFTIEITKGWQPPQSWRPGRLETTVWRSWTSHPLRSSRGRKMRRQLRLVHTIGQDD